MLRLRPNSFLIKYTPIVDLRMQGLVRGRACRDQRYLSRRDVMPEPHIVHIPLGPVGCSSAPVNMFMMDLVKFPNYNHNEFTANG